MSRIKELKFFEPRKTQTNTKREQPGSPPILSAYRSPISPLRPSASLRLFLLKSGNFAEAALANGWPPGTIAALQVGNRQPKFFNDAGVVELVDTRDLKKRRERFHRLSNPFITTR
jgi:hypothetical protein